MAPDPTPTPRAPALDTGEVLDVAAIRARHRAVATGAQGPPRPGTNLTTNGSPVARCERCGAASANGMATCDTVLVLDALDAARAELSPADGATEDGR